MDSMNINMIKLNETYVFYDLETVYGEIQIVARFVKNGEEIGKIYKISTLQYQGAEMVAKLLDDDFAIKQAEEIVEEMSKSKHSRLKEL